MLIRETRTVQYAWTSLYVYIRAFPIHFLLYYLWSHEPTDRITLPRTQLNEGEKNRNRVVKHNMQAEGFIIASLRPFHSVAGRECVSAEIKWRVPDALNHIEATSM